MYLLPIWCLCLLRAISLCSWETNLTRASPFLRPCGDKHKATPPLKNQWTIIKIKNLPITKNKMIIYDYLVKLRPRKNLAMSWSEDCHGRPRALTMQFPSISSSFELKNESKSAENLIESNDKPTGFEYSNIRKTNSGKKNWKRWERTMLWLIGSLLLWPRNDVELSFYLICKTT